MADPALGVVAALEADGALLAALSGASRLQHSRVSRTLEERRARVLKQALEKSRIGFLGNDGLRPTAIESICELLAADGWQIEVREHIIGPAGCVWRQIDSITNC